MCKCLCVRKNLPLNLCPCFGGSGGSSHTHTYIYTHTHTYAHLHTFTHAYTYLHTLTHLHTLSNNDKLRHTHTHTPHTFTHIYPHLHTRKCTYTHSHTHKLAGAGACGCMWVRAHVGDKRAGNGVEAAPIVTALSHKKSAEQFIL